MCELWIGLKTNLKRGEKTGRGEDYPTLLHDIAVCLSAYFKHLRLELLILYRVYTRRANTAGSTR